MPLKEALTVLNSYASMPLNSNSISQLGSGPDAESKFRKDPPCLFFIEPGEPTSRLYCPLYRGPRYRDLSGAF
jgi:hypothetical protein